MSKSTEDAIDDSIPLYTKTAIFAILCILIVFVLFIYCQSSVRHYMATNVSLLTLYYPHCPCIWPPT